MVPQTREEFSAYCLRALGDGVIQVNVSPQQIDDRIDEALNLFAQYHMEGSERMYYKYCMTQTDIDNGYITVPENILGVTNMWPIGTFGTVGTDIFSAQFQIVVNDLYTASEISLVPYYMTMEHLQLVEQIITGLQPIRFNRFMGKVYIDMTKERVQAGQWLIFDVYMVVDPEQFSGVWSERWLYRYTTALIKKQWGMNTSKYTGMQLPGGVMFNGQQMLADAEREIEELTIELKTSYQLPVLDMYN